MAFNVIQGFDVSKNEAIDPIRMIAVDEDAMLAIKWVYNGLIVVRTDKTPREQFICTASAATQAGTPNYTQLSDWESFTGTSGIDGIDGSVWFNGVGVPSDGLGVDGDYYLNDSNGDYYLKAAGTWGAAQGQLSGPIGPSGDDGDKYATSSATSVNITTALTTLTMTVGADLAYTAGQDIIAASAAAPLVDNFSATVTSYAGTTLNLGSIVYAGSGAHTDWAINLAGAPGQAGVDGIAGKALVHLEYDITLTAAKITSVQGGGWTTQDPWAASILLDSRTTTQKNATAGILGDQAKNSIAYDGSDWFNNGRWVGSDGSDGSDGEDGEDGVGTPGADGYVRVVNAGWNIGGSSDHDFPIVSGFDGIPAGVAYAKRVNVTMSNFYVSTPFYIEFPSTLAALKDLVSFTIGIDYLYAREIICRAVAGTQNTSFYDNNTGLRTTTFELSDYINGGNASFTFTPHILGNSVRWSVVGGSAGGGNNSGPNLVGRVSASGTLTSLQTDGASWSAELAPFVLGEFTVNRYKIKRNSVQVPADAVMLITPVGDSVRPYIITAGLYPGIYFQIENNVPETNEFNIIVYLNNL